QIVPSCGTTGDPTCLITTAQYTVLGTVISNNANTTGSPTNYNATIDVSCVYASFGVSQGVGAGLADAKVLVSGFGDPYPGCPNNLGASAPVNQTEIFFIYVANRVGQNATPFYTIFNPCGGGLSNSTGNLEAIRSTLEKNPKNSVLKGSQCALPA
ncbi:uncharacterized protein EV422DRAFT_490291, partial [Fimicolochytrium jonesii]|uniref:uncharacterized protein n=1 Tax=Fimicolochytrium jonesii TaxID=1396493 RepID=UPI0022FDF513